MRLIGICLAMVLSSTAFGNDFFMGTGASPDVHDSQAVTGTSGIEGKIKKSASSKDLLYSDTNFRPRAKGAKVDFDTVCGDDDVTEGGTLRCNYSVLEDNSKGTEVHHLALADGTGNNAAVVTPSNGEATASRAKLHKYLNGRSNGTVHDCFTAGPGNDCTGFSTDAAARTAYCVACDQMRQRAVSKSWDMDSWDLTVFGWDNLADIDGSTGDDIVAGSCTNNQSGTSETIGGCGCAVTPNGTSCASWKYRVLEK